ncbi:MAG: amidohydrolase [Cyclobacteriaceae bacterium]
MLSKHEINRLVQLRHQLHQKPELSGEEKITSQLIKDFLEEQLPDEIIENVGGYGVMAIYHGQSDGPTLCFRCDLDALPIQEINDFDYKSNHPGVAHKCGHDGHMTIVSSMAMLFKKNRPAKGKLVLLYQPAEETGEGASRIIKDEKFKNLKPDYIIGLHNLPGYQASAVIVKDGVFAAASKGMEIKLIGATAHAAEPENGRSPALAMAKIIKQIESLPATGKYKSFVLTTVVHAVLGKIAYGTTPGYAEVRATLRAYSDNDLEKLTYNAERVLKHFCLLHKIDYQISYTEEFPATESSADLSDLLMKIIRQNNLKYFKVEEPFRWSEDFGHFKKIAPTLFFGLGAGQISSLHNYDYDFPDQIIPAGTKIFYLLAQSLLCNHKSITH